MSKSIQTTIEIFGQSFTIRTEPDEEKDLKQVADEVNEFLKNMSRKGTVPIHRLALMASFHYAYELHTIKHTAPPSKTLSLEINKKLDRILRKLESALENE